MRLLQLSPLLLPGAVVSRASCCRCRWLPGDRFSVADAAHWSRQRSRIPDARRDGREHRRCMVCRLLLALHANPVFSICRQDGYARSSTRITAPQSRAAMQRRLCTAMGFAFSESSETRFLGFPSISSADAASRCAGAATLGAHCNLERTACTAITEYFERLVLPNARGWPFADHQIAFAWPLFSTLGS